MATQFGPTIERQKVDEERDVDMEDMLHHIGRKVLLGSDKGLENFEMLKKAAQDRMYVGCETEWTMLCFVLHLLKAKFGWSDNSFNDLITLLGNLLPKPNFVPKNTYEAKEIINPLKMRTRIYHKMESFFDGTNENDFAPKPGTGKIVFETCENVRFKLEVPNGKHYLPPASYNLTPDEKLAMFKCLLGLKVPTGFSSNIRSLVSLKDMMLAGYNSHDCHVMITVFLAIAIWTIKSVFVKMVITRICYFFNVISQKVIECVEVARLQLFIWTYEWFMSTLNGYMRNKAFPKGSMIESNHTEVSVDYCIDYKKDKRAIGLPESRHEGGLSGKGTIGMKRFIDKDNQQLEKVHSRNATEDVTLTRLASGPSSNVTSWEADEINGYTFYTTAKDIKSVAYQNSSVRIEAIDTSGKNITYYGSLELKVHWTLRITISMRNWTFSKTMNEESSVLKQTLINP
uniref:Uncharacterized protein n=1 Tax=Setaria italica TaxID=4555 RepID=K3YDP2_SETIT